MASKVSIIVPARQEGVWLANTLESIWRNTDYPNYEVIVIDDASKDGCSDGLEERFKDMPLTVIRTKLGGEHGPAVSRNKGLRVATGDYIATLDGHMVVPKGWLTKMVDFLADKPRAIVQTGSTGFRSVADRDVRIIGTDLDASQVRARVKMLMDEVKRPCILEVAGVPQEPGMHKKLTQEYQVPVFASPSKDDKTQFILHVKDSVMDEAMPDPMQCFGCILDFDPEDRNFITPKWTPWYNKKRLPKADFIQVAGLMGATYLFPRSVLVDRLGGWPWVEGWVHEETYFSIAAGVQGIPIYVLPAVITAHNYDRVDTSTTNTGNKEIWRQLITEIAFDDMKGEIQDTIFTHRVPAEWTDTYDPLFSEYRAKVQGGRMMSDQEFLGRNGLLQYFHSVWREKVAARLGGGAGKDLSTASVQEIKAAFQALHDNPLVNWQFLAATVYCGGEMEQLIRDIAINDFDPQSNKRLRGFGQGSMKKRAEAFGMIFETLVGEAAFSHFVETQKITLGDKAGAKKPHDENN